MPQRQTNPHLPATIEEWTTLQTSLLALDERSRLAKQRRLARESLYYLIRYILDVRVIEHPWLLDRCIEVQQNPDGYLDLWAREHGKTLIITTGLTLLEVLQSHGENPDPYHDGIELCFGIFSFSRTLSRSILEPIRKWCEENELLRKLFPDIIWQNPRKQAKPWTQDFLLFKRRQHRREITLEAWGLVDSSPTGKHFDRLVFDDVIDQKSVNTPEMIAKSTNAWRLALPLGRQGGSVRYIGTRYNFFDTYHEIIQSKSAIERIYPATDDGSPEGKPVLVPEEHLEQKYRELGPFNFSAQYLLDPRAADTQAFDVEWINFFDGDMPHETLHKYVCVDPAGEGRYKRSDYTSMWVVGLGADQNFYVLDLIRDKINLTARAELLFSLVRKYKPKDVIYEQIGIQADIPHLQYLMQQKAYHFNITPVGGNRVSKNDRIRRLIPSFQARRWYFPRERLYTTAHDNKTVDLIRIFLEEEYKPFPVGRHPDMIDSLSRLMEPDISLFWPEGDDVPEPEGRKGSRYHRARRGYRQRSWMAA